MGKEKWCYINSGQCSPAFNMALDECLLNWQSEKKMHQQFVLRMGSTNINSRVFPAC